MWYNDISERENQRAQRLIYQLNKHIEMVGFPIFKTKYMCMIIEHPPKETRIEEDIVEQMFEQRMSDMSDRLASLELSRTFDDIDKKHAANLERELKDIDKKYAEKLESTLSYKLNKIVWTLLPYASMTGIVYLVLSK